MSKGFRSIIAGLIFSILWASASTATKIGLTSAQPFVICVCRFFLAGTLMIGISRLLLHHRLPSKKEWGQIALYGLLSNAIYLGLYVLAMKQVSAGLGSLGVATNPVFINLLSILFLGKKLKVNIFFSLLLCMGGVLLAAWPLLQNSSATPAGLLLLLISMLAYSIGVILFSRMEWNQLPLLAINGWQVLIGGIILLPVAIFNWQPSANVLNIAALGSIAWLAIPVSICAVQLWLFLLKEDAGRSSFWLFLCPVFGFILSNIFTHEPITAYTVSGMILVIAGIAIILIPRSRSTGKT